MSKYRDENDDYKRGYTDGLLNAIEHGHWDDSYGDNGRWCCSCCDGSVDRKWDYCPHCGAMMDEIVEPEDPRDLYGWQI